MNVYIHRVAGELEEQQQRGPVAGSDGRAVPGFGGPEDERVADRAPMHEDIALTARRLGLRRPLSEARHLEWPLPVGYGKQRVGERPTPQRGYAVDGVCRPRRFE